MSYRIDKRDNSLVIEGFDKGIANSPFEGITDMRNVNTISVPGEASANFSTVTSVDPSGTGNITSADPATERVTITLSTGSLPPSTSAGTAVTFAGGSLPTGLTAGTVYWLFRISSGVYEVYTSFNMTTKVNITATGTGTWATVDMGVPKYFTRLRSPFVDTYFMVDSNGRVWNNGTPISASNWRFTGNSITGTNGFARGNGLVAYVPSDSATSGKAYLFVFRDFQIDYALIDSSGAITWTAGWKPSTGGTGQNSYLKCNGSGGQTSLAHEALLAPDNRVYYCDANYVSRFYQASPSVGFDPLTPSTYVFDETPLLPFTDSAQCLAFLGTNILVGGVQNVIYPWDRYSNQFNYPILISENNIVKMVTINTNTYIFAGNRGRIFVTNGSQAQLFKKIPDHISGTVEPYFTWGGATFNRNQLYFGMSVTTNTGAAISQYGGLWAIDTETNALRLTNKLSYDTYAGYATAITSINGNPSGTGMYIGWDSGASTYGIDTGSSTPYSGDKATITSDLIPVGSFDKPQDYQRIEYKLTKPLTSGESIKIYARLIFDTTDTGFGSVILSDSTVGNFSSSANVNFKNAQWLQIQAVLNSTSTGSPNQSFVRLKEIRIR